MELFVIICVDDLIQFCIIQVRIGGSVFLQFLIVERFDGCRFDRLGRNNGMFSGGWIKRSNSISFVARFGRNNRLFVVF